MYFHVSAFPMMKPSALVDSLFFHLLLLIFFFCCCCCCHGQQPYLDNKQLNCYAMNDSSTLGYSCNGARNSCASYLTFRSATLYQSPVQIAYLLGAEPSNISSINGIADVFSVPKNDLVLVPAACSCAGRYYQHNASYTLNFGDETYLIVANDTYQGLTTCQALMAQNPYESHNLSVGLRLDTPLRCACPTADQQAGRGTRYLLTYLVTWGDDVPTIANRFGVDLQAVLQANSLSSDATIYPFTTLLIPLATEPTRDELLLFNNPPVAADTPGLQPAPPNGGSRGGGDGKRVFLGVGIGVGVVAVFVGVLLTWWFWSRHHMAPPSPKPARSSSALYSDMLEKRKLRPSPDPVSARSILEALESLNAYEFQELEKATGAFNEDYRIKGSVYKCVINGDEAAVKRLKGDVAGEINILKQINHTNVIRLSGFCLHEGNTYLVYEFAEKGSLEDWLHQDNSSEKDSSTFRCLSWMQRVQIAQDVADALNYLHNYINPPYVHQDLKSSNVLLDAGYRAKIANFAHARPVDVSEERAELTRHVMGTHGYMAPEYLEHGLITPKLDVFAFGVVILELLSGKEATFSKEGEEKKESLLWTSIEAVLSGEDVRSKLRGFVDPFLQDDYPFDLAFAMAELAMQCVAREPGSRPSMTDVFASLSAIYQSTLDWDPSDFTNSSSIGHESK